MAFSSWSYITFRKRYLEVSAARQKPASIDFATCVQPCVIRAFCRVSDTSHLPSRTPAREASIGSTLRDATLVSDHRNLLSEESAHEPFRRAPWGFGAARFARHAGLRAAAAIGINLSGRRSRPQRSGPLVQAGSGA